MAFSNARFVIRSSVVTVAAILLAALCWMSGLDRMAASSPWARSPYFGGSAAAQFAFDKLAQNDPHAALSHAKRAVQTAPVDPAAVSALASALLALNQSDHAYVAFEVSGLLGWRDLPTQLYWLTQGVTTGAIDVAKPRLDALLRLDIDSDAVDSSLDLLERTSSGQTALASLLIENPPWESRFLLDTSNLDRNDFEGRLSAISLAASKGAAIDCGAVGIAASRLIVAGRVGAAKELWRGACDRAGDLYVSDGTFEIDPGKLSTSPFNWRLLAQAGLDVGIVPAPTSLQRQGFQRHALKISSSRTVRTVVARQLTAFAPGQYHLSWISGLEDGKPDHSITVLIRCNGTDALDAASAAILAGQPNRTSERFTVPQQGCPIQAIDIQKAASLSGNAETGWIDNIEIAPVR